MDSVVSAITIALAVLGITDSIRLIGMEKAGTILRGQIGPGVFLLFISMSLLICASVKLGMDWKRRKAGFAGGKSKGHSASLPIVSMISICILYALALPILGYPLSSACFFCLVYYITGVRPWSRILLLGIVVATCFYLVFGVLIEVPFPKGFWDTGL